ncbi:MAG TPA: vanadium-dependent haloperoxidase [Chryseolinea sp.]|nr:vanadium-dependent haloperoxidase [Chryseolinea sp.]
MIKLKCVAMLFCLAVAIVGCDDDDDSVSSAGTETYSSEMVVKWLNIQARMLRVPLPAGVGTQAADRAQAYSGIALYEAVVQGMPTHHTLAGQLTDFPAMPEIESGVLYHWAVSGNAALAEINRLLFPTASVTNKASVDSLETALQSAFATDIDAETMQRSIDYGKLVASKVYDWAASDGSGNTNPPYVPSGAAGTWVSTPPNFPPAVNPYASQRRLLVPGVATGTTLSPPPAYSAMAGSEFYNMVKDVYDKSLVLTPDQTAMALYHRDAPGYPGGGHFVPILAQVLSKALPALDVAAIAYAKVGIAQGDATVVCFTYKYSFNQVRPITYIRNEMGHATWNALFNTPGHPEFPAAHATISSAVAEALTDVFGDNFAFTLNTYAYLGLPNRSYTSFRTMSKEMADSRVFGGIHYQASCDKGRELGKKVAENVLSTVDF